MLFRSHDKVVAAFTEKKTVEHVLNPELLKKQITETLRGMSDGVVDVDALLVEVRGGSSPSSSSIAFCGYLITLSPLR